MEEPKYINHKGLPLQQPFMIHEAKAVYLYSLLKYQVAETLCERQNYKPVVMKTATGDKKAGGFVIAADYRRTSAVPYREWLLGICVSRKDQDTPEIDYINECSMLFQDFADDVRIGNCVFSPKIIASDPLPVEIGHAHYGMPKETGRVTFDSRDGIASFSASTRQSPWIMKASVPVQRGPRAKIRFMKSMFNAYSVRQIFRSTAKKEFVSVLVGSADILARNACITGTRSRDIEVFPWDDRNCRLEINRESKWGAVLHDLSFAPVLVCFFPDLCFQISEPLEQITS